MQDRQVVLAAVAAVQDILAEQQHKDRQGLELDMDFLVVLQDREILVRQVEVVEPEEQEVEEVVVMVVLEDNIQDLFRFLKEIMDTLLVVVPLVHIMLHLNLVDLVVEDLMGLLDL
jgi:hypothetical protein